MIDIQLVKNTVHGVLEDLLDCNDVIWMNQGEHRPQRPYATLQLTGPIREGHDDHIYDSVGKAMRIKGMREFALSVNYFGIDGMQKLAFLQMANEFNWVRDDLATGGVVYVSSSDVRDLTELEDAKFSTRYQLDVQLRVKSVAAEENVGYIEATQLNNGLDDSSELVPADWVEPEDEEEP